VSEGVANADELRRAGRPVSARRWPRRGWASAPPGGDVSEEAGQLLDRMGVAENARVIDIGRGALGVLDLLCAPAGPGGRVVGVDRQPRIVDAPRQVAAQRGLPIEFVPGDAADLALPPNSFHFVHEHTVSLHVQYPAAWSPR